VGAGKGALMQGEPGRRQLRPDKVQITPTYCVSSLKGPAFLRQRLHPQPSAAGSFVLSLRLDKALLTAGTAAAPSFSAPSSLSNGSE
jgi:hypothetical protein